MIEKDRRMPISSKPLVSDSYQIARTKEDMAESRLDRFLAGQVTLTGIFIISMPKVDTLSIVAGAINIGMGIAWGVANERKIKKQQKAIRAIRLPG